MYLGLDLGSRNVKIALMENGQIIRRLKYDTVVFYRQYGQKKEGRLKNFLSWVAFRNDI